jgi:hypothetical protein
VPVPAPGQAEVVAADPQPAVAGGVGEHLLEQRLVRFLERLALDQRAARIGDLDRQRITDLLELAQVEHPGRTGGGDPMGDDDAPEALGDQPAELTLEPGDLPAQLGAGQPLVDRDSVEHSPHSRILSGPEGRGGNP